MQNDEPDNDAVVHRAMEEGRLRRAPVLLIDRRVDSWVRRYPDVHVQTVAARQGRTRRDENHGDSIQLAVVGSADAEHVARLVWPDYHPSSATPTAQCCWSTTKLNAELMIRSAPSRLLNQVPVTNVPTHADSGTREADRSTVRAWAHRKVTSICQCHADGVDCVGRTIVFMPLWLVSLLRPDQCQRTGRSGFRSAASPAAVWSCLQSEPPGSPGTPRGSCIRACSTGIRRCLLPLPCT